MKRVQLLSAVLAVAPAAIHATAPAEVLPLLKQAGTASDRIALLKDDSDFVFNFLDPAKKAVAGAGGRTVSSNVANFPALFGAGIAMTLGFMQPCSLNSPHTHPRASEVLIMINGTIEAGFLAENGARFVMNTVEPMEATVFPRGSIRRLFFIRFATNCPELTAVIDFQANLGCKPVLFAATLNHEDPGTLQVAQRFFALPAEVVDAALGGLGHQQVAEFAKHIPDNLIQATESCFTKCNLPPPAKGSQPTSQQQAVSPAPTGNKAYSDNNANSGTWEHKGTPNSWFGAGNEPGSDAGHGTHHDSSQSEDDSKKPNGSNVLAVEHDGEDAENVGDKIKSGAKGWFSGIPGDPDRIALVSIIALNIALVLGALVFCCVRSTKKRKLAKNGGMDTMQTATGSGVSVWNKRDRQVPRPLLAGGPGTRGKYAAAEFELPPDTGSGEVFTPRKYDDPYDKPPSRSPTPLPPAHNAPYHD
ncbi:RmlC-like cupin [Auriculariales sp. MPI-PUGE-AT-0066]|nr:RmlC-like cupin [Auriculariales sp. MPI-PUGE-AT-0066]